jgi:hypothetical protein
MKDTLQARTFACASKIAVVRVHPGEWDGVREWQKKIQ